MDIKKFAARTAAVTSICAAVALAGVSRAADDLAGDFRFRDENGDRLLSGRESRDIREFDTDGDGDITPEEFAAGMRRRQLLDPAGDPRKAFAGLDENGDGTLSGNERKGLERYDSDADREVTLHEFLAVRERLNPAAAGPIEAAPAKPRNDPRFAEFDADLSRQYDAGKKWAILVGVGKYQVEPLPYSVADARLLADTLEKHCGYSPERITLVTDDQADERLRPTKAGIRDTLRAKLADVGPSDTVVVFFSGHGVQLTGNSYLCPIDFNPVQLATTAWSTDELRELLQGCKARQKLLILDCCHAGGAGPGSIAAQLKPVLPQPEAVNPKFSQAQGLITFASSRSEQVSFASNEFNHSYFTYALCRGLAGRADADGNLIVDSDELYRHVAADVPQRVAELTEGKHLQTPVRIIGQDVVGVFALARPTKGLGDREPGSRRLLAGEVIENSIGMKFVLVPQGLFIAGSPRRELGRSDDEEPHIASMRKFAMGVYEVSQAQFTMVMGTNPSWYAPGGGGQADIVGIDTSEFPVEEIDYLTAVEFCKRMSALPGEQAAGRVYRLPTEAEWEYACRGGTPTPFSTGEQISSRQANLRGDLPYGDSTVGPTLGRPTTVGLHDPNPYGLFDMHGNVAEWCADFYSAYEAPFSVSPVAIEDRLANYLADPQLDRREVIVNPRGPAQGAERVFRGGSFQNDPVLCRSAARRSREPTYKSRTLGFRVVVGAP
jgi:formylglycine-generating enzyme required for sulfatase activity